MLKRAFVHTIRYLRANALALTALFVALGGTGYAAAGLHDRSSSTRQPMLKTRGQVVGWAIVNGNGHVVASSPRAHVFAGHPPGGDYQVSWHGVPTSRTRKMYCAATATVDGEFSTPDLSGPVPGVAGDVDVTNRGHVVYVNTFNPSGQPTPVGFEVALICPES